ncbi:MAG: autotransporter domain-containing protein, partial [bacterium]
MKNNSPILSGLVAMAIALPSTASILRAQIPISYDLRSVNGGTQAWVPTIQNQGTAEDCWTFASATAMNSNLLKTGLLPASSIPPAISVSSWHLSTRNGSPDQLISEDAFSSSNSNWGGDIYQTLGYVTRGNGQWHIPNANPEIIPGVGYRYQQTMGGGPIFDSQYPINPFPVTVTNSSGYPPYLGPLVPAASQSSPYRVATMSLYDQGFSNNVALPVPSGNVTIGGTTYDTYNFNLGVNDPQVAVIKNALLSNGAVTTYMNADGDFHTVSGAPVNTIQYFNSKNATAYSDHAVTIIGWNDTYTMTDPKSSVTSTGAWLVQNSWGSTTWNNSDGTFWASYNDAVIGRSGVASFTLVNNAPYSTTVLQNELGPMDYSGNYYGVANVPPAGMGAPTGMATRNENTVASILTPTSNGELLALGIATQVAGVLVQVSIYDSWNNGPANLLTSGNFTFSDIGYFQADLPTSLNLTANDPIVVELTYLDADTLTPVSGAIPITVGGSGINGYTQVTHGLSYYLDGSAWRDFADVSYNPYYEAPDITGGIVFLKGITALPLGDYTWTGGNGTGWNTASNWASDEAPPAGTIVNFCTSNQTNIDTQSDQNLGGIVFNACAPAYTISNNTITLSGNILNNSTFTQTINSNLVLENQPAFIAAGGNLAIGGSVSFGSNGTLLAIGGNYATTVSGAISGNGIVSIASGANVVFSGNNTYTGGTALISGNLQALSPTALGNGPALLIGGSLAIGANTTLSGITDLYWASTNSTITLASGGNIGISGNLSSGNFSGNRTFDFSPGALQVGNNTLVTFDATDLSASRFAMFGGLNLSLNGTFQIIGKSLVYTLTGGSSSGNTINNNANAPAWSDFTVAGNVITVGAANTINALNFTSDGNLAIQPGGQLAVTTGTLAVQNGSSIVSGGNLVTPGHLNKLGSGELDLQSNTSVNGTASIDAGLLSVNGQLTANSVVVNPAGTLGGSGAIFAPVLVSGTLSPGNSPGTLSVGSLVLAGSSVTNIEIASLTNFDRIVVAGPATVGGSLNITPYNGNPLAYGQQYAFLTAAGGIAGEFSTINAPEAFRGRFLNLGTIGSILIAPDTYTRVAITQNQKNVAKALDTFIPASNGDRETVSIALDSLTASQYPYAFEQIMPGFYESLANIAIEQAFNQTQMLNQRISSVRLGAAGFQAIGGITQPLMHDKNGKSAAEAKDASPIVESATATNWNAWALGTGMFSRTTDLGRLQNYNNDAGGFLVGSDYRWSENFVTGLYAGYDYSYAEYNGGSSTKGNSFSFGTYASYAKDGYYADAVIGGGYTGFQTKRSMAFSTIDRTASADPNSGQFTAGLNLGKDFEVGKFTLGPIVGAQYTYAGIGAFTESGADSLDLAFGQQNANSLRSTLGGRVAYTWNLNQKIALIPEVRMF